MAETFVIGLKALALVSALAVSGCFQSALAQNVHRKPATVVDAEREAVLQTVQILLDGRREADAGKSEAVLHPDFREVTLHMQDGKWKFESVERSQLIKSMARIPKGAWDDKFIEPQVHIDGPIALVWSRYKFTVTYTENGQIHAPTHCGVETFQLYRYGSGWKIVNFADTHMDSCP